MRASICSIRTHEEVQALINEGVFRSWEDVKDMEELASKILTHKCDCRCLRRVGDGDGPENFRCRKLNNLTVSNDNTKDTYLSLETKRSPECIARLVKIGLAEPITYNEHQVPSRFKSSHHYFHPVRHIPPTNPNNDLNISPVEGYTFSILKSMQNIQYLHCTNGLNKYVCKYIGKIDEQNYVIVKSSQHDKGTLMTKAKFLHNTKIATSAYNEKKSFQKDRSNFHPRGRIISLMEMIQLMLSYSEVRTDMNFEVIATVPLEQRAGVERTVFENVDDGIDTSILSKVVREEVNLPTWRRLRNPEILILQGYYKSSVSIDKITKFSLRPPELRGVIDKVGDYYRWFYMEPKQGDREFLENGIKLNLERSMWIDGLQHQVLVRKDALEEILQHFKECTFEFANNKSAQCMVEWFQKIHRLNCLARNENEMSSSEKDDWKFISENLLYECKERHLPVPVFSYVKPTMGPRFLLHILLSMGRFETETDLLLRRNLRESFRYAKLIGDSDDIDDLTKYSNCLLRKFIEEQLVYFPNSSKVTDSWIVTAGELFDSVIVENTIPIHDMPPVLQTQLDYCIGVEYESTLEKTKSSIVSAALTELSYAIQPCSIPTYEELMQTSINNAIIWDACDNFQKFQFQSEKSYQEQSKALRMAKTTIDQYLNASCQHTFVKCNIISGAPGSGKTFLMMYLAVYAVSKGLTVGITAMMSKRAIQIGGSHIHQMFCLPVKKMLTLHRIAEMAFIALMGKPAKLKFLVVMNILFIDELSQVSSEMLGTLDVLLRKIRNNDIFMGGVLVIGTLDQKQLAPIKGKPFLTSPHVLSCFQSYVLKESVRASTDANLQRILNIARMNPKEYITKPSLLKEFKNLLSNTCTFVGSWNSSLITPDVHRVYGEKIPARHACEEYISQVKHHLSHDEYVESICEDFQLTYNSHEEWQEASEETSCILDHKAKEPRRLLFFAGAKFQFTYNEDGIFSQSQIGLMIEVPSRDVVRHFGKISILVVPAGCKNIEFNPDKSLQDYLNEGFCHQCVGVSREKIYSVLSSLKAQRKQYGLKPYVTSTIHSCMGDTLCTVATEISSDDGNYKLWDKAQVIVLLSRTKTGKNLIFVGNKQSTIKALTMLIQMKNQWSDYMDEVIDIITLNKQDNPKNDLAVFQYQHYPFEFNDVALPQCNTGFVYMIVSTKDHNQNYIGETFSLGRRLNEHNRGYGSEFTSQRKYSPWFLIAYVCGFNHNKRLMKSFEKSWQKRREFMLRNGQRHPKVLAQCCEYIIGLYNQDGRNNLRLIILFKA